MKSPEGCLYYRASGGEVREIDCTDALRSYPNQGNNGLYWVSYSARDDVYSLYFVYEGKEKVLIRTHEEVGHAVVMPNDVLLVHIGNSLKTIDAQGQVTVLVDEVSKTGNLRPAYYSIAGRTVVVIVGESVFVTDGSRARTWRVHSSPSNKYAVVVDDDVFIAQNDSLLLYTLRQGGMAELIYHPEPSAAKEHGYIYGLQQVGDNVVFAHDLRDEGGVMMRVDSNRNVSRLRVGEGGEYCHATTSLWYPHHTYKVDQRLIFEGDWQSGVVMITDGTDAGTKVIIPRRYSRWSISLGQLVGLQDSTVAITTHVNRGDSKFYVYDLKNGRLSYPNYLSGVTNSHGIVETTTDYLFGTSSTTYSYSKATSEITQLPYTLSSSRGQPIRDQKYHYALSHDRAQGTSQIVAIKDVDSELRTFDLPAPYVAGQSVRLFMANEKVYAVVEEKRGGRLDHFLYEIGPTREETHYLGPLPPIPLNSSRRAFAGGGNDELYLYSRGHRYSRYTENGVEQLSEERFYDAPTGYLGTMKGRAAFASNSFLIIPELGLQAGFSDWSYRAKVWSSSFVALEDRAYLIRYRQADGSTTATAKLYVGGPEFEDELELLFDRQVAALDATFEAPLLALDANLLYVIPTTSGDSSALLWYQYNTVSGEVTVVEPLRDSPYRGRGALIDSGTLYFVTEGKHGRELVGYTPGLTNYSYPLNNEEELVELVTTAEGRLLLTTDRIIALDQQEALYSCAVNTKIERGQALGEEIFLEIYSGDTLGFYIFRPQSNRLLPLATDLQPTEGGREYGSSKFIGQHALFTGIQGGRQIFYLYNGDQQRMYEVGTVYKDLSRYQVSPLIATYQGKFMYQSQDREYGIEMHHFRPPYTHRISGTVYQDVNSNERQDESDHPLANARVSVLGKSGLTSFTDSTGHYTLYLQPSSEYEVVVATSDCYSSPTSYLLKTTESQDSFTHDFLVSSDGGNVQLTPHLASGPARCSFTVPFWLTVTNDGCQPQDGEVTLELHDEVVLVAASSDPMVLNDGSRTLHWNLPTLAPGGQYQIKLQLKMPDEDLAGQEIPLPVYTSFTAADGTEVADTFTYDDVLRCAIDPNDKRSFPRRAEPTDAGYVQFDETITYMIRFQNTGNDTAFTVRLEDQLSDSLDYTTFQPLTSSHDYEVTLTEEGLLEVLCRNILLVDSTTNEPGSHGFFTFSIEAKEGLKDFDEITNRAGIFFDFNRPVITNRARNTFVEALDADGDGYMFFADCDDTNAAVNPGMADIPNNGIDEDCDGADLTTSVADFSSRVLRLAPNPTQGSISIKLADGGSYGYVVYDARGQRVGRGQFRGREATVDLSHLASGVYLLQLTDAGGGSLSRRVVRQ